MKDILRQYLEMWQLSGVNQLLKQDAKPGQDVSQSAQPLSPAFAEEVIPEKQASGDSKAILLQQKCLKYANCKLCSLWKGRNRFVYGEGNPHALLMVIGEGPGEQENLQGRPFVGPAGNLLDKMLAAIGIQRGEVYIANIVKCRPPSNRNPQPEERNACLPYLKEQVEIIQPEIFLLMGLVAAQTLLDSALPMHKLREQNHTYSGKPVFVTYHPSALLRNPNWKVDAWKDLKEFRLIYDQLKSQRG